MNLFSAEICLLTNARRTASIVAQTTCDVFILSAEDFRQVLEEHPAMRSVIEAEAEKRLNRTGATVSLATKEHSKHCVHFQPSTKTKSSSTCSCQFSQDEFSEHVISREVVRSTAQIE